MRDDVLAVRAPLVTFYVLKDAAGLYLIDTGFVSGPRLLRRALRRRGWDRLPVRGILLTHGHLDHMLNAAPFAQAFGAWIAAPRLDASGYAGAPEYTGLARVTGVLEGVGRKLFRFRPFTPDRWIDAGTELDVWHGLRAVHLPGHTVGHFGFHCERLRLLFSGDLYSSHYGLGLLPPGVFNSRPELMPASVAAAARLDLAGVLPNHGDDMPPAVHLARLRALDRRLNGGPG